jgi:hypothetical protein
VSKPASQIVHSPFGGKNPTTLPLPAGSPRRRLDDRLARDEDIAKHDRNWISRLKSGALSTPRSWCLGICSSSVGIRHNWTSCRGTAVLKAGNDLYVVASDPYASVSRWGAVLAERVEGLVSHGHSAWMSMQDGAPTARES